jgi:ribosome maturation factor RimP
VKFKKVKKRKSQKKTIAKTAQSKILIEQTVRNLVGDLITNLGYELWDIEYYHDGVEWLLEITIDRSDGISIDDCEKVTRAVNPVIDAADPIEASYSLAVSSPGLNRELKNSLHLNKYINKEVTVKLYVKNETAGDKIFNAVLKEFSDGKPGGFKFELLTDGAPVILTKKEIAHIYAFDEIDI